jgi:lipopolysaccharide/colanic/teichoic acid biosynthesis glycosyltransferase
VKRVTDVVISLSVGVLLLPVIGLLAFLIRRDSAGNAFFVQERVGKGGVLFDCYKFRTMRPEAEAMLEQWKTEGNPLYQEYLESNYKLRNDPRVTRIGAWLRKRSLDELPQLLNVLKGDMSLVGPRPLLLSEVAAYGESFARYKQVRPGLTGLWQVSGRSDTDFSTRIELDVNYINTRSTLFDLRLMWRTLRVLLDKSGAY